MSTSLTVTTSLDLHLCLHLSQWVDKCLASTSHSVWSIVQVCTSTSISILYSPFYRNYRVLASLSFRASESVQTSAPSSIFFRFFFPTIPAMASYKVSASMSISVYSARSPSVSPSFAGFLTCQLIVLSSALTSTSFNVTPSVLQCRACKVSSFCLLVRQPRDHSVSRQVLRFLPVTALQPVRFNKYLNLHFSNCVANKLGFCFFQPVSRHLNV